MQPVNHTMTSREWIMLLGLSVLWGGSFLFIGIAVKELPPFTIVFLRVAIAALTLGIVVKALGLRMPSDAAAWRAFMGMGLLNNMIPFCLIVWGQTHIASGLAAILNATTPLWTVVIAHWLTADEKMTGGRVAGVLVGFMGVAVMIGPDLLMGFGSSIMAQVAVLGAAISYGFSGIYGRRFKRMGIGPLPTAAGQITASSLMLAPVVILIDRPWTLEMPGLATWGAIIGIATLSTALAYVIFFRLLATAGATNLSLVTFLIPVSAIAAGALVLGERLGFRHLLGMALIAIGLAAIDGRLLRLFKPSEASPDPRTE